MKRKQLLFMLAFIPMTMNAQVDYSVVSVNEEKGIEFHIVTSDDDYVAMPQVKRRGGYVNWLSNRTIGLSPDGRHIAYISARNNATNIFVKEIGKNGSTVQRTNRQSVLDFSYSPDGEFFCFTEIDGNNNHIFQTSAVSGYVCRQITSGAHDYSPIYSHNMRTIFFARQENKNYGIWSYSLDNNSLSNYAKGTNPYPVNGESCILCTRLGNSGRGEIWRINYSTGVEECILAAPKRSFSTPQLSPDGKWILMVGSNVLMNGSDQYANTDIFVCRIDGTNLHQLTYHAADDLSPVWSNDGKHIFFISQRGSSRGTANVWRMTFNVQE